MENKSEILLKYIGLHKREKRYHELFPFLFNRYVNEEDLNSFRGKLSRKNKKFATEVYYKLENLKSSALKKISELNGTILRHPKDIDSKLLVDSVFSCLMKKNLEKEILNNFDISKETLKERYLERRSVNPKIFEEIGKNQVFYIFLFEKFLNK
jgi:hypothetical protein